MAEIAGLTSTLKSNPTTSELLSRLNRRNREESPGLSALRDVGPIKSPAEAQKLRKVFQSVVAGTFYKTMLAEMRKSLHPEKTLLNGGRAEEVFRGQLDQTVAEKMAEAGGEGFAEPMFQQFLRMHQLTEPTANGGAAAVYESPATRAVSELSAGAVDRVA